MPQVTVKSGSLGPEGEDDKISAYFCDAPNCPNMATAVIGCFRELRLRVALCDEHAAQLGPRIYGR